MVLCHGVEADGGQFHRTSPALSAALPDLALFAPHAPHIHDGSRLKLWTGRRNAELRQWFSLANPSARAQLPAIDAAACYLDGLIEAEMDHLQLPPGNLVLLGYSQGAIVALLAGLRRPVPPRAIISYAGGLCMLPGLISHFSNRAPVLLLHGMQDSVVPPTGIEAHAAMLRSCGVPARVRLLPGIDHTIDLPPVTEAITQFLRPAAPPAGPARQAEQAKGLV